MQTFKITDDCSELIINDKIYPIPPWYNKNMIAARDEKTLQMIFIHHQINYLPFFSERKNLELK